MAQKSISIERKFALAIQYEQEGNLHQAIVLYQEILEINPNYASVQNNLGNLFDKLEENEKAISCYQNAIQINPTYDIAYNNLGNTFAKIGKSEKAIGCYQNAIQINPVYVDAYNNLGNIFAAIGKSEKAISCYQNAIQINPNHANSYWHLHQFASNMDEAIKILNKVITIDDNFFKAKATISALKRFKGNFKPFEKLATSTQADQPLTRSIMWLFSLSTLPKIVFNRWNFYDEVAELADKSRPFYEFGVWNGISFQYLINIFGKGFGFDTFAGLPESWHGVPKGAYSSFGTIPKITGANFIVGEFKNTLPKFFQQERPLASVINFDADLYSSTLCALNNSSQIIDEKTILIFDEFIGNENWEIDEYKALNDFCNDSDFRYDVLLVSLFTKQVAVKLKKSGKTNR